jgi:acyl-CoA hydrolase
VLSLVIGVSLLREVLAGFVTRLDTPPVSGRHHPVSAIALRPISVGDEVSCYCSLVKIGDTSVVVKIGDTSVVVKVETWARGRGHGKEPQKVTEGVFTFVALDEGGHPRTVAGDNQG